MAARNFGASIDAESNVNEVALAELWSGARSGGRLASDCVDSLMKFHYKYLEQVEYADGVELMQQNLTEAVQQKTVYLYGLEHPLVYTRGLTTKSEDIVNQKIKTVAARRGGSITLHNPGQLVFYLVMPLALAKGGLDGTIRILEAAVIETLEYYNVIGFRHPPHSGVFTQLGKIAFVGLGMKKNCIYHGLAINIDNNLEDYSSIHSCGLTLPVTRMKDENGISVPKLKDFSKLLSENFTKKFAELDKEKFKQSIRQQMNVSAEPSHAFRVGMNYFNERLYWQAHEAWELFWLYYNKDNNKNNSEFAIFLQGMIQLAMALYKLTEKPNLKGALSLLKKSKQKLANNSYSERYIHNMADVFLYIDSMQKRCQSIPNLSSADIRKKVFSPYVLMNQLDYVAFYKNL